MEGQFVGQGGWRRVYVDLPGMGKTPGPDWITCADDVLEVLEEFVDSVIGDESFSVAGTSYGAYLALGLVHRRAARIEGVLLSLLPLFRDDNLPGFVTIHEDGAVVSTAVSESIHWLVEMAVTHNRSVLEYARALAAGAAANKGFLE